MSRTLLVVVWLTVVWMALWEAFSVANLISGLVVALATVMLVPVKAKGDRIRFHPLAFVKLVVYFSWKLVQAAAIVAWEVITPRDHTRPAVMSVPLHTRSPGIATAVANMVSLTPGTLTIDVDPDTMTLFIHLLHHKSPEAIRAEVHHLESLTLAAFPRPEGMS